MKSTALFIAVLLVHPVTNAQNWTSVGLGPTGNGWNLVSCLYGDTATDRLLAGGTFFKYANANDTVWALSKAQWNGARWDSLGTRVHPTGGGGEFAGEVYWFLRYQGGLYACGDFGFTSSLGYTMNFGRLNDLTGQWEDLGCTNAGFSGLQTVVPKEPQNTLYITGSDGVLCDQFPPTCVYSFDGSAFQRWTPFDQIPDNPLRHVSYIFDFLGETYMVGVFNDPLGQGVPASFLRYNGSSWEHVPGWGNLMASIWDYSIRNDTLYIGGDFLEANGGPGNLVASFDGVNWNNLGGGLSCVNCWSANSVNALQWFHGELWACGMFDQASDVAAHGIAKWDGQKWCVPPGNFLQVLGEMAPLYDMAVWRDSLYVCGLIGSVDGEPVHQVAKWAGGNTMEVCSTVGVVEPFTQAFHLEVVPMAEPGMWRVQLPDLGVWTLDVFNVTGRQVGQWQANGVMVMDLSARSPGMYLLRATGSTGALRSTKLVRP